MTLERGLFGGVFAAESNQRASRYCSRVRVVDALKVRDWAQSRCLCCGALQGGAI